MNAIISLISRLTNREEGQTLTEYGLILAFIAIVVIIAATFLGDEISDLFSRVALRLQGAGN